MSNPLTTQPHCPDTVTIQRAGDGITSAPDGIANGPFLAQFLLSSSQDGEMTAMRTYIPPGVMPHWHSHPCGQLLFVLDGVGIVHSQGALPVEVRTGDCVWFPPNHPHSHGATASSPFSYLSVQIVADKKAVTWFDPVETADPAPDLKEGDRP